jgi:hypothetical protein
MVDDRLESIVALRTHIHACKLKFDVPLIASFTTAASGVLVNGERAGTHSRAAQRVTYIFVYDEPGSMAFQFSHQHCGTVRTAAVNGAL